MTLITSRASCDAKKGKTIIRIEEEEKDKLIMKKKKEEKSSEQKRSGMFEVETKN